MSGEHLEAQNKQDYMQKNFLKSKAFF